MKVGGYEAAVAHSIVAIFCDTFQFLYLQRCFKDLEELKILRKFWVGKLHPVFLSQMKENVWSQTKIDIDAGIKQ